MYTDDELLMISGIQHFVFCPRQWYLIHIEQIWAENELTALGQVVHQKVHDPLNNNRNKNIITLRSLPLVSYSLGVYGYSDAVELHPASEDPEKTFVHPKYPTRWNPIPVEYKRGLPKKNKADALQICAQAMCIEESYGVDIPFGYIFYNQVKHRETVAFDTSLRNQLFETTESMHQIFKASKVIPPTYSRKCRSCSLLDQCLPKILQQDSASSYLRKYNLFTPCDIC